MKFKISRASTMLREDDKEIEINDLKDLLDLVEKEGDIIIHRDNTLLIYDNYIE